MRDLLLIKFGGSLLTDKRRPDTARPEVVTRLARELAAEIARPAAPLVVLGHGSGSYGHVAAARFGLADGWTDPISQRPGIALTQRRAADLHRRVIAALIEAGAAPFSIPPSACTLARDGRPEEMFAEPVARALDLGLLPVVFGDVVLDRSQGVTICSTEAAFGALLRALPPHGYRPARALWLGETAGVLDEAGRTIEQLAALPDGTSSDLPTGVGGAAGTDVTGGMSHRLQTAFDFAAASVPSVIFDGRDPGALARAIRGEEVSGTLITGA
ncbi:MAG: isopentenyl phosphate kinase [Acidobacteriota bacterium]